MWGDDDTLGVYPAMFGVRGNDGVWHRMGKIWRWGTLTFGAGCFVAGVLITLWIQQAFGGRVTP